MKPGDEEPAEGQSATELQAPVFRRLRDAGQAKRPFETRRSLPWLIAGGLSLAGLILVPLGWPSTSPWAERIATAMALFWLITAVAMVFRLRRRAPWVAAAVTLFLYGVTAWLPFIGLRDLFVLTVVVGFAIFVLAGFNLLFVLEEVVYDIHRLLHLRGRVFQILPLLLGVALVPLVYIAEPALNISLGTLQFMLPVCVFLLLVGWVIRWRVHPGGEGQLREIHLLVVGAVAGAGLADAVGLLRAAESIIPSVVAYVTFIGTWIYVSYTSLQRAQYFVPGNDVLPWLAILLSSSFAVLAHVHSLYSLASAQGIGVVADLRVGYLVLGVWLGLAFFVLRGFWRLLQFVRDERGLGRGVRRTAGRLARVTEEIIRTEERLEDVTTRFFARVDRMLPGEPEEKPVRRKRRRMR